MAGIFSLSFSLLLKIFSFLRVSDKNTLLYVSTQIRKVASDPLVWQHVKVNKAKLASELKHFLSIPRFGLLVTFDISELKLEFSDKPVIAQLLKYLHSNTNLQVVNFTNNNLSKITPFPFSSALTHCHTLGLSQTKLETEQINSLLGKCCSGKYAKNVDFSFNDLTFVNPDLLARSIDSLERINLSYTELSAVDTCRIVERVTNSGIKEIDLSGNDLSLCQFDNVGLNQNLTGLRLAEVKLNQNNLDFMFTNISLVHNLCELNLNGTVLSSVEPVLFSDAVTRIVKVDLNFCWLYCEHIEFLLDGINADTKIKQLNLSGNHFEEVNRDLILEALTHLDVLRIEWANMKEEHFETLVRDTFDLKRKQVILNHFELIENHLDLHRVAKENSNIVLNMVQG